MKMKKSKINLIAMQIMNLHKLQFLQVPNRTHPESTASKYATLTGMSYEELLVYYTHPCPLSLEEEGEIAFKLLSLRIKYKNVTQEELIEILTSIEEKLTSEEKSEFSKLFFS